MKLSLQFKPGSALMTPFSEGSQGVVVEGLHDVPRALGRRLSTLVSASTATKPRGTRGFSFHWSNAQAKWDVISANDPTWALDGAEFILYVHPTALSPLNKSWTLKEMQYIAASLPPHPGFSRAVMAARVAARFIAASPDRMDERSAKAHGFELVGLFGWDNHGDSYDDDDGYNYEREGDWSFRDADMILYYGDSEIGRMDMDSESGALRLLKSLKESRSAKEAIAVLTPLFQHDRTFRNFLQSHPQLIKGK